MQSPRRKKLAPTIEDLDENVSRNELNPNEEILFRKRKFGAWKRRRIILDACGSGSLYCYSSSSGKSPDKLDFHLPRDLPWVVQDVEGSQTRFTILVNLDNNSSFSFNDDEDEEENTALSLRDQTNNKSALDNSQNSSDEDFDTKDEMFGKSITTESVRGGRSLKFYFKCPRGSQGKSFWLKHFEDNSRMPRSTPANFSSSSTGLLNIDSIPGSPRKGALPPTALQKNVSSRKLYAHDEAEVLARRQRSNNLEDERFLVKPDYAYRHTKLTREELRREMLLPSSQFHDLRLPSKSGEEIGLLRVEVLQCFGLPKLDTVGDTDAHAFLVAGSYAFKTDIIPSNANPMWLSKMRRACIFPVYHAYATLFAGVFDDDGPNKKDDFAGRVAVDLSRLRPNSTYDVTMPLRASTHMYERSPRGSIRLRFHLSWTSERAALLSYIPTGVPKDMSSAHVTTLQCGDDKALRNVALTVHGSHLSGNFSLKQLKSTIREINFTRIIVLRFILKAQAKDTVLWKRPAISLFVFAAWMHCVYINSVVPVPGHLLTFLFLHLMRNYARFGMDGRCQFGYVPPTWEEMFVALWKDSSDKNSSCISPLDLRVADVNECMKEVGDLVSGKKGDTNCLSSEKIATALRSGVPVKMRRYKRKWYNNVFLGSELVEFIIKSGYAHSREDAVKLGRKINKELNVFHHVTREHALEDANLFYRFSQLRSNAYIVTTHKPWFKRIFNFLGFEMDVEGDYLEFPYANGKEYPKFTVKESLVLRNKQADATDDSDDDEDFNGDQGLLMMEKSSESLLEELDNGTPGKNLRPPPAQDMSVKKKKDNPIEKIAQAQYKVHRNMGHLFDSTVYEKKKNTVPTPSTKKSKRATRTNDDVDKLLNLDMHSHSNNMLAKLGMLIEPIIGIALAILGVFRALFNIFTWRDPMFSFWVSIIIPVLVVILHCFPWRIFMFLVGIAAFGPQNLIFRIVKERYDDHQTAGKKSKGGEEKKALESSPGAQPIFTTSLLNEGKDDDVTNIRVPYSPIKYQRFYDWPPESQYGRVKSDNLKAGQVSFRATAHVVTAAQTMKKTPSILRRREPQAGK